MKRRTFLQASAAGLGLASLESCQALPGFSKAGNLQGVDDAHIVFDADSPAYLIFPNSHQVRALDASGNAGRPFGSLGEDRGELNYPIAGAVDDKGRLYVLDRGNSRIEVFDAAGRHQASIARHGQGRGQLSGPTDLAIGADGMIFVSDTGNHRVQVFKADGTFVRSIEGDLNGPRGITVDSAGAVHVVDSGNSRVVVFDVGGKKIGEYGGHGDGPGEFLLPRSIASDGAGMIFVGDPSSGFVSTFNESGEFVDRTIPRHDDGSPAAPLELSKTPGGQPYVWTDGHLSHHHANS